MYLERDGLMSYGFNEPTTRIRLSFRKGLSRFLVVMAVISGCVGFLLSMVGEYANRDDLLAPAIILTLSAAIVFTLILGRIHRVHTQLHEGSLREFYATENDFSYQLMFADEAFKWVLSTPEIADQVDELFAHPEVVDADMAIRDAASRGFDGLVDIYLFRQLTIEHLKRLDEKHPGDYWRSIHVRLEQELDDEYQALLRLQADMATPP